MAALAALPYTRRVTTPDDAPPADLLKQARTMIETAARLIDTAEGRLAAPLALPADTRQAAEQLAAAGADARAAVELHRITKDVGQAAQSAAYTAVRRLKRAGATREHIRERTGLTASLIKWIVEDHASARRARRRQRSDAGE